MAYEIYCKNCNSKLLKYEKWERKYKSPVSICKKCGKEYLDPRSQELAVTGIPKREFKISKDIVLFIIGGLVTWRGHYLFGMHLLGTPDSVQWVIPAVVLLLGIVMLIASIIDALSIITGLKKRKYEKLLSESKERMNDDSYVTRLKELGYIR